MDIATGIGLLAGAAVVCTLILLGGDFRMFYDLHALIVIFGGSTAATAARPMPVEISIYDPNPERLTLRARSHRERLSGTLARGVLRRGEG